MSAENASPPRPSLRIAEMAIQNFRTFRERTVIPFSSGARTDAIATFHGANGSGKSNALAALDLFFRGLVGWMRRRPSLTTDDCPLRWNGDHEAGLVVSPRDWPTGVRNPLVIEVLFADAKTPFTVMFTPAGNECILRAQGVWAPGGTEVTSRPHTLSGADTSYLSSIRNQFEAPLGPGSTPLFRLDARRHDYHFMEEGVPPLASSNGPLAPDVAGRLLDLSASLDPVETERWRAFTRLVARFETLGGREVSAMRMPDGSAELRFEIRGKQILRVSELSSGEQQVVALCAALLTSRAAVVAIEEPEISLHPDYQRLVRDVLTEQVQNGVVDQILIESHVAAFDGPHVIRFERDPGGPTRVSRAPSETEAQAAISRMARAQNAQRQWVTRDGYTELPEIMRRDLGLLQGGGLWFLKGERWEAWPDRDLEQMLGGGEGAESDDD